MVEFADAQITYLFPTAIWRHKLPEAEAAALNDVLAANIEAIIAPYRESGRIRSYQTHQALHRMDEFSGLMEYVTHAGHGVLQHLEAIYEDAVITGCWANVNQQGIPHREHFHANNYLSGVYYVRTPSGEDVISFLDPRDQTSYIAPPYRQENDVNAQNASVSVSAGDLIVFPAWLKHWVPPNKSPDERISISFNFMFSNYEKTISPPQWQGLGEPPVKQG